MFDLPGTAERDASTAVRKRVVDRDEIELGIPIAGLGVHIRPPQACTPPDPGVATSKADPATQKHFLEIHSLRMHIAGVGPATVPQEDSHGALSRAWRPPA